MTTMIVLKKYKFKKDSIKLESFYISIKYILTFNLIYWYNYIGGIYE